MSNLQLKEEEAMAEPIKFNNGNEGIGFEEKIYTARFSQAQEDVRQETWDVLVQDFLSKYIRPSDCVVD